MRGRRKQKEEEESNSERWLVSYADFITLLFAFFTTLYAISTVDAQKMGQMVMSMRASFDSRLFESGSRTLALDNGTGGFEPSTREILQKINLKGTLGTPVRVVLNEEKDLRQLEQTLRGLLPMEFSKGRVRVHIEPRGLVISLGEKGLFDSGSDEIKPEGRALLDTIASTLASIGNHIRVEGHTDNVPIRNTRFPSNWELSTCRATMVNRYLITKFGLKPELLSAAGYAEYRPAATNDTEEGRARNRRVDIVVLNPAVAEAEPQSLPRQ
ncbi:MAG: OmpA family protein [Acidobacteria bacterium]|nr:OmpA family protein [Acidobacteriota bacterium]